MWWCPSADPLGLWSSRGQMWKVHTLWMLNSAKWLFLFTKCTHSKLWKENTCRNHKERLCSLLGTGRLRHKLWEQLREVQPYKITSVCSNTFLTAIYFIQASRWCQRMSTAHISGPWCSDVSLWKTEADKAASQTEMWQSCCCRGMQTQTVLKLARELWPLQNLQKLQLRNLNKHIILSMGKLNENVILGCTPNNFLSHIGVLTE